MFLWWKTLADQNVSCPCRHNKHIQATWISNLDRRVRPNETQGFSSVITFMIAHTHTHTQQQHHDTQERTRERTADNALPLRGSGVAMPTVSIVSQHVAMTTAAESSFRLTLAARQRGWRFSFDRGARKAIRLWANRQAWCQRSRSKHEQIQMAMTSIFHSFMIMQALRERSESQAYPSMHLYSIYSLRSTFSNHLIPLNGRPTALQRLQWWAQS